MPDVRTKRKCRSCGVLFTSEWGLAGHANKCRRQTEQMARAEGMSTLHDEGAKHRDALHAITNSWQQNHAEKGIHTATDQVAVANGGRGGSPGDWNAGGGLQIGDDEGLTANDCEHISEDSKTPDCTAARLAAEASPQDLCQGRSPDHNEEDITLVLKPDNVVAWMLHGLTNAQKNKILIGTKVLTQMTARSLNDTNSTCLQAMGVPHQVKQSIPVNPLAISGICSTEAYEKHMDKQAQVTMSNYERVLVPVCHNKDEDSRLTGLPPIPVYMRPLQDALSCAFAASCIPPGGIHLTPQQPENSYPGRPVEEDRVQLPMQGRMAHQAHGVC